MSNKLDCSGDYYEALKRLQKNRPRIVAKDTRITNDAVSLEAGRGKGSIKRGRVAFANLIAAIEAAQSKQPSEAAEAFGPRLRGDDLRILLDAALAREVSLLMENFELKRQLARLTGANVLPIRGGLPSTNP